MRCYKEFVFSFGFDKKLVKYNFKSKALEQSIFIDCSITALKILKTVDDNNKVKLAAALINGTIALYDLNL